jgi:hypothetical protein
MREEIGQLRLDTIRLSLTTIPLLLEQMGSRAFGELPIIHPNLNLKLPFETKFRVFN